MLRRRTISFLRSHLPSMAVTCACALGLSPEARAQTTAPATQPAESRPSDPKSADSKSAAQSHPKLSAWQSQVSAFADALLRDDAASIDSLVSDDCRVHQFDRNHRVNLSEMRRSLSSSKRLVVRGYLELPESLASDIAADVRDASDVSDEIKHRLVPDDAQLKRANATAVKWISTSLTTVGSDAVGVIVLLPADSALAHQPVFVLLRGAFNDGQFRICEICYGDPLPAPKENNVAGSGD